MEFTKESLTKEREGLVLQIRRIEGAIIYIDQKIAEMDKRNPTPQEQEKVKVNGS